MSLFGFSRNAGLPSAGSDIPGTAGIDKDEPALAHTGIEIASGMASEFHQTRFEFGADHGIEHLEICGGASEPSHAPAAADSLPCFAPGDMPPSLPQDPYFQLPPTCLFVRAPLASHLGNDLCSFLQDELHATSVKLRTAKFTAKAAVFCGETPCTVKMRVYQLGCGVLVVELQRRQGDALAFAKIFRLLSHHLEQRYTLIEGPLAGPLVGVLTASLTGCPSGSLATSPAWLAVGHQC